MKLKQNEGILDFDQLDERRYNSLISCNMLKFFYPFVTGEGFSKDLKLFKELKDNES